MAGIHGRRVRKITCCPQVVARVASHSSGQPEVGSTTGQPSSQQCKEQQNCLAGQGCTEKSHQARPTGRMTTAIAQAARRASPPGRLSSEAGSPSLPSPALTLQCGPPCTHPRRPPPPGKHAAHVAGARHVAAAGSRPLHPPCSFLCTISPAKSRDLGIWGPREKDAVRAQPLHQRIN